MKPRAISARLPATLSPILFSKQLALTMESTLSTLTCFKTIASNTTGYLKHLPNSAMSKDLRKKPFSRLNLAGTSTGASTWVLTSA